MSGKNPQLCLFIGLFCPFCLFCYTARTGLFSRISSNITCFTELWICLDKTKQKPGVLSFISQKSRTEISANFIYLHIINLPWDINHKFKTHVFHFKLIHSCSGIHIILASYNFLVQLITTVKKSKGNYTVMFF